MKLVIIESPYAGDLEGNLSYARACMSHSLSKGEAPFASHLLYTQPGILDDTIKEERLKGMVAGFSWMTKAELVAVYIDRGITAGMKEGIKRASELKIPTEYRNLR